MTSGNGETVGLTVPPEKVADAADDHKEEEDEEKEDEVPRMPMN